MKRALILFMLLLFATAGFAREKVIYIAAHDSSNRVLTSTDYYPTWFEVDSAGSRSVYIDLPNGSNWSEIESTGFGTLEIFIDTTATDPAKHAATNLDTIDVLLTKLSRDRVVNDDFVEPAQPVSGDTTQIRNDFKWRVGHADNKYQIREVVNHAAGTAQLKVTFSCNTVTNPFRVRVYYWMTIDK
jgi:hypothetical protein